MTSDWIFVIGFLLLLFGLSRLVASWVAEYVSVPALVMMGVGVLMIGWAWFRYPEIYAPAEMPNAFIRVIGYVLNGT